SHGICFLLRPVREVLEHCPFVYQFTWLVYFLDLP
uniref:Uncharacterized protein n=1 Tax=Triticum urartu TaxID=4572 RepID=A0A8R7Q3X1_TRIUA